MNRKTDPAVSESPHNTALTSSFIIQSPIDSSHSLS